MKIINTGRVSITVVPLLCLLPSLAVAVSLDTAPTNHNRHDAVVVTPAMAVAMNHSHQSNMSSMSKQQEQKPTSERDYSHDAMAMNMSLNADMDKGHGSMGSSGMNHGAMEHSSMDMSSMQGGKPPKSARSSDYSNGVGYGRFGKPMMMGSAPMWGVSVSDLEYDIEEDVIRYEAEAWYGLDDKRIRLKSEGSADTKGDKNIDSLTSISYWQPIGIFWNVQAGAAYDTAVDKPAVMAGIEGTAPYFIETDADMYVYSDGQVRLNAGAEYDWRLNQHWVVVPEAEVSLFAKDDTEQQIAKGLYEFESKLRLKYETLNRQVAPYIGVSYETALGANRALRREQGESVDSSSVIAGLSFWF